MEQRYFTGLNFLATCLRHLYGICAKTAPVSSFSYGNCTAIMSARIFVEYIPAPFIAWFC